MPPVGRRADGAKPRAVAVEDRLGSVPRAPVHDKVLEPRVVLQQHAADGLLEEGRVPKARGHDADEGRRPRPRHRQGLDRPRPAGPAVRRRRQLGQESSGRMRHGPQGQRDTELSGKAGPIAGQQRVPRRRALVGPGHVPTAKSICFFTVICSPSMGSTSQSEARTEWKILVRIELAA